jgi:hypothetical protein
MRIPRQLLLRCSTSCIPAVVRPRHTVHPEHKVEGFQHDMGRAIAKRLLVAVHDPALTIHRQALGGDAPGHPLLMLRMAQASLSTGSQSHLLNSPCRRASNVAAQAFQAAALMRCASFSCAENRTAAVRALPGNSAYGTSWQIGVSRYSANLDTGLAEFECELSTIVSAGRALTAHWANQHSVRARSARGSG